MKDKFKRILFFILVFLITLLISLFINRIIHDEVWNYGFGYNISKGLIPYKDFNMVIPPLFHFIEVIFIKIFGNYLYSVNILNSLLITGITLMIYKRIKLKSLMVYPILVCYTIPSYNTLCLFFLFLILFMVKDSDILIGLIIGLTFITKQTIGLCLVVPYLYYSRKRVKGIILFLLPMLVLSIYLIYNNIFYNFLDYCFFSMFDFASKNSNFSYLFIVEVIICIGILIYLIKNKFKEKNWFYILAFQIMAFPLSDLYHFIIAVIPIFVYLFVILDNKYFRIGVSIFLYYIFMMFNFNNISNINIIKDDNFMYLRNYDSANYYVIKTEGELFGRDKTKYKFIISPEAYLFKLYSNTLINNYDLLMNGNMGYDGSSKTLDRINNICINNSCKFYVKKNIIFDKSKQFDKSMYN